METKTSNRQLAKNMSKMLEKRVLMIEGNHKGEKGFTSRVHLKNGIKPVMMVKLDSGSEIEVSNRDILFLLMEDGIQVGEIPSHLNVSPETESKIKEATELMSNLKKNNQTDNTVN